MQKTIALRPGASPLLRLGFGCEQLGGHRWGRVDLVEVESAIAMAVELGIGLFDTADCYGLGESERRLGRLLRQARARVLIATKFGVRFDDNGRVFYDSSPDWAEVALNGSLERLGCESVDLFQLHYWDGRTDLEDLFERLERLRDAGKCRYLGATNLPASVLASPACARLATWSLEYSLIHRESEAEALDAVGHGLALLSYGTLGQGLLSAKYSPLHQFPDDDRRAQPKYINFHGTRRARSEVVISTVRAAADALGTSPSRIAVAWVLAQIPRCIPLVGIKRPEQLLDVVDALDLSLPPEWQQRLEHSSRPHGVPITDPIADSGTA